MPRARRLCRVGPHPAEPGKTYCAAHAREVDAARGTRAERGYGPEHQRQRLQWAGRIVAGTVKCWRCGERIRPGQRWVLGHDDTDRSITRGPEHESGCNARAAGLSAHGQAWTPPERDAP